MHDKMSNPKSDEIKKNFKKATDEGSVKDGTYGHTELNKLKLYLYHHKDKIEYIDFRTSVIKQQMQIIQSIIRDNRILKERNRKLKDICERNNIGRRRRNGDKKSLTTKKMGGSSSSSGSNSNTSRPPPVVWAYDPKTKNYERTLRSDSMEAIPPRSRQHSPSSLSTIQESQQFRVKHLNEPPKQIPNNLLEAFAKDDRESPFSIEKYEKQQEAMYERLRGKRKPKKSSSTTTTTTTTAPKKSSGFNSSNIDYSNMMWEPRRKRTQTQANSGSSGSSIGNPAKKKCTETYKVGDIVDVTAYGGTHWSATIKKVGPNIAMMGSKRVEIKAGQYLVIFNFDGKYDVVSPRWKREGWYISKLIARKPEEKSFEGLDLNKMNIKF